MSTTVSHPSAIRPPAARAGRRTAPVSGLAILCAAVAAAATAGILFGEASASGSPAGLEPALVSLLRFMAVIKAASAAAMLMLTAWRLRRPTSSRFALAYIVATSLAAAAPGLIWSLSQIALGAALFHVGLTIMVVAAWRDGTMRVLSRSRQSVK